MKKKDRTNEERTMNCGMKAKIIEYRGSANISIQFEDDTIVRNKTYNSFKNGMIRHPVYNYNNEIFEKRINEERTMNCGMKAKIIKYYSTRNITIQFEDGKTVRNRTYGDFKKGIIQHPVYNYNNMISKKRINEERTMNCGMKAKIIEYRGSANISIQFEDGTIVRNKTYGNFKNGLIRYPTYNQSQNYINKKCAAKTLNWNGLEKIKSSNLNDANVIILDASDFLKIKIDKTENKITEIIRLGKETNIDYTKKCIEKKSQYTIGDIVFDTPYTLGMVAAKLLEGSADDKCIKMLSKVFDYIFVE